MVKNSEIRKPNLFIVGAPKCGTTSLCKYLEQHPQIYISPHKEPNYFGSDLVTNPRKPPMRLEEYLELFKEADVSVVGEGSTWYLYSQTAPKDIISFSENSKILIVLRNPVDFLYSYHNQSLLELTEDITDFQEALLAETDRRKGLRIPKGCIRNFALYYREVASFSKYVENYLNLFGQDRVHIILFDDFVNSTSLVYRNILKFLEVDDSFEANYSVYNSNTQIANVKAYRAVKRVKWWTQTIGHQLKGLPFYYRLRKLNSRLFENKILSTSFIKKSERPPLPENLRNELIQVFRPEIQRLEMVLSRNLSHWLT